MERREKREKLNTVYIFVSFQQRKHQNCLPKMLSFRKRVKYIEWPIQADFKPKDSAPLEIIVNLPEFEDKNTIFIFKGIKAADGDKSKYKFEFTGLSEGRLTLNRIFRRAGGEASPDEMERMEERCMDLPTLAQCEVGFEICFFNGLLLSSKTDLNQVHFSALMEGIENRKSSGIRYWDVKRYIHEHFIVKTNCVFNLSPQCFRKLKESIISWVAVNVGWEGFSEMDTTEIEGLEILKTKLNYMEWTLENIVMKIVLMGLVKRGKSEEEDRESKSFILDRTIKIKRLIFELTRDEFRHLYDDSKKERLFQEIKALISQDYLENINEELSSNQPLHILILHLILDLSKILKYSTFSKTSGIDFSEIGGTDCRNQRIWKDRVVLSRIFDEAKQKFKTMSVEEKKELKISMKKRIHTIKNLENEFYDTELISGIKRLAFGPFSTTPKDCKMSDLDHFKSFIGKEGDRECVYEKYKGNIHWMAFFVPIEFEKRYVKIMGYHESINKLVYNRSIFIGKGDSKLNSISLFVARLNQNNQEIFILMDFTDIKYIIRISKNGETFMYLSPFRDRFGFFSEYISRIEGPEDLTSHIVRIYQQNVCSSLKIPLILCSPDLSSYIYMLDLSKWKNNLIPHKNDGFEKMVESQRLARLTLPIEENPPIDDKNHLAVMRVRRMVRPMEIYRMRGQAEEIYHPGRIERMEEMLMNRNFREIELLDRNSINSVSKLERERYNGLFRTVQNTIGRYIGIILGTSGAKLDEYTLIGLRYCRAAGQIEIFKICNKSFRPMLESVHFRIGADCSRTTGYFITDPNNSQRMQQMVMYKNDTNKSLITVFIDHILKY